MPPAAPAPASAASALAVVPATSGAVAVELVERARAYAADARSSNTRRAYAGDWSRFEGWCASHGTEPLPPDPAKTASYAAWLADGGDRGRPYAMASIRRALASIAIVSRAAGFDYPAWHPVIVETLKGIARRLGTAQRKAAPLEIEALASCAAHHRRDLLGIRDRAIVALGFFFAARRSELAAVRVEDIEFTSEGLRLTIRRSKTDQEGQGVTIGIPRASDPSVCPIERLRAWLDAGGVRRGAVFRRIDRWGNVGPHRLHSGSIARIVKTMVASGGLDSRAFAGHSLRSGFITTAAKKGKGLPAIMRQSRHRSERVVLGYVRVAQVFEDNAANGLA